jgi:exodeoxyribonuclease-3
MKILTWNIQHGGGSRINQILIILNYYNADLVVLTEFRNNKNKDKITQTLNSKGYHFFESPACSPTTNTVLIGSKTEFTTTYFQLEVKENSHRIFQIELNGISIYPCYFPQKNLKKPVFEFLIKQIKSHNPKDKIIVIGDLNTGKHYIDEDKNTFYYSEYLLELEKYLTDAFRQIHGPIKEFSWYSSAGNGFRIDHCFTKNLQIQSCTYHHQPRTDKVSDHSIMEVEISL